MQIQQVQNPSILIKFHTVSNRRGKFSNLRMELCILLSLLSGLYVKFAHQNFTDLCYNYGHCGK